MKSFEVVNTSTRLGMIYWSRRVVGWIVFVRLMTS